jgi:ribosomal protein L35
MNKTKKSVAKRVKVTKNGKMLIRKGGQNHFNSRDTGNTTKGKRRDNALSDANRRNIKALLPHNRV